MGFERNYQVLSLSKQRHTYRCYTTYKNSLPVDKINFSLSSLPKEKFHPLFITGFVDGEGSFKIGIVENKNYKTGFHIWLSLSISLHVRDRALLEKLQLTLGVGRIGKHDSESIQLQVTSIKEIKKIIEHFDKFPLKTKKIADYKLWKEVYNLIINNEHHTIKGIKKNYGNKGSK